MLIPPAATACQLWAGVPGTQVAIWTLAVGTTQLMSPTSVDALVTWGAKVWTSRSDPIFRSGLSSVARSFSANATSSAVYRMPLIRGSRRTAARAFVRKLVVDAVDHLVAMRVSVPSPPRREDDALPEILNDSDFGVPAVVVNLAEVGDDVRAIRRG
jgi:hypothetical protein